MKEMIMILKYLLEGEKIDIESSKGKVYEQLKKDYMHGTRI
jgi:hypothetical protein